MKTKRKSPPLRPGSRPERLMQALENGPIDISAVPRVLDCSKALAKDVVISLRRRGLLKTIRVVEKVAR